MRSISRSASCWRSCSLRGAVPLQSHAHRGLWVRARLSDSPVIEGGSLQVLSHLLRHLQGAAGEPEHQPAAPQEHLKRRRRRRRNRLVIPPNSPHLQELFPHVLALLPGFVQRPLVVERGGLVRPFRQVFEESQPAEMLHTLRRTEEPW